jgi:hypothetical protein
MLWFLQRHERQRRNASRYGVEEDGVIATECRQLRRRCIFHDISKHGTGAVLDSEEALPRLVTLIIPQKGLSARARTIWQIGNRAGFRFLD